jgi:hypothetical protein
MVLRENNTKTAQRKTPPGRGQEASVRSAKQNLKNAQNLKALKSRAVCVQTAADDNNHRDEHNGTDNFQT